jgi:PAS domain S-box-containing protein
MRFRTTVWRTTVRLVESREGGSVAPDTRNTQRPAEVDDLFTVLDRLTDGILVLGPDWHYRYVNEPAEVMLGRQSGELLGKHIWTEFPVGAGEPFHDIYLEAARSGQSNTFVQYHPPLERWFEHRVFPQDDNLVVLFRDVTEQQLAEQELREHGERMSEAERIAGFGVWKWDVGNGRVRWSDELHRIYGLRPGEFGGTVDAFMEQLHPDDRERVWAEIGRSMESLEPFVFEERIVRADGEVRILLSQGRVLTGPDGAVEALVGVCHDVTDRTKIERELGSSERRMRAIIDNTPSIISVKDLAGQYLMSNAESGRLLGVAPEDLVGKHCVDVFPPDIATAQVENDRRAASEGEPVYDEAILTRDGEPRTYVTVTFALPDEEGRPVETCTIATDVTERKERESERRERIAWTDRIGSALEDDQMLVFAQPIVDVRTGEQVSEELLVRMRGAAAGEILAPGTFLPAAERYGLVQDIDLWMVRQALALPEDSRPHLNLSAVTMCDPAARTDIVALLASSPAAAKNIVFEITETASPVHLEAASGFAKDVTALGCRLALDDFGTGFGSFTYLRSLPVSFIKIDISFVRGLLSSPDDRRVVQTVIGIAERFDMKTIAEGAEDQETLEVLGQMGADHVQGFHVGRPAPLA